MKVKTGQYKTGQYQSGDEMRDTKNRKSLLSRSQFVYSLQGVYCLTKRSEEIRTRKEDEEVIHRDALTDFSCIYPRHTTTTVSSRSRQNNWNWTTRFPSLRSLSPKLMTTLSSPRSVHDQRRGTTHPTHHRLPGCSQQRSLGVAQ